MRERVFELLDALLNTYAYTVLLMAMEGVWIH